MADNKEAIRSAIQNLIKDNSSQAAIDFHPVITTKMQELVGTARKQEENEHLDDLNDD